MKSNLLFRFAIIFTILTIVLGVVVGKDYMLIFDEPVDFYGEDFDIITHGEGGLIEAEIEWSLGCCGYETTTYTKNGKTTSSSSDYFYVIPAYTSNDYETYFVCVQVYEKDRSIFEKLVDDTYEFLSGGDNFSDTTYSFRGTLDELDDEFYIYALDCMREIQYFETEEELNKYVLPLYLRKVDTGSLTVMFIVNIVLLLVSVLFWVLAIRSYKKAKREKENPQFVANDMNCETINIYGRLYPKHYFSEANSYVMSNEIVKAIKCVRDITGLGLAEAKNVVDNWTQFYR